MDMHHMLVMVTVASILIADCSGVVETLRCEEKFGGDPEMCFLVYAGKQ
jgi:hypothetical protein